MSKFLDYAAEVVSNNNRLKLLETTIQELRYENDRLKQAVKDKDALLGEIRADDVGDLPMMDDR